MAKQSDISWCDATFNPWIGCTEVSTQDAGGGGCDGCYARTLAARYGWAKWGHGEPRHRTSADYWKQPDKWNAAPSMLIGRLASRKPRVFGDSLCDVFDNEIDVSWRADYFALIKRTPRLQWIIVTKRIGNAVKMLPPDWGVGYPNVVLLATVVNQAEANRDVPKLLATPAFARGLSIEPMLGPIDLTVNREWLNGELVNAYGDGAAGDHYEGALDWVICGGESDQGTWRARPMHPAWPRALRDQCAGAHVPFHFKQQGEWEFYKPQAGGDLGGDVRKGRVTIMHPTGQTELEVFQGTGGHNTIPGSVYMRRVGLKAAGRKLSGIEHNGFVHQ